MPQLELRRVDWKEGGDVLGRRRQIHRGENVSATPLRFPLSFERWKERFSRRDRENRLTSGRQKA